MRHKIFKTAVVIMLAAGISVFVLTSCSAKYNEFTSFAMGSEINARIFADDENSQSIFKGISSALAASDGNLSNTNENSDISEINSTGKAVVSDYTLKVLEDSIAICNICNRTVDITLGSVTSLWGFNTDTPSLPTSQAIAQALEKSDLSAVLIDEDMNTVTLGDGQILDLGAFGKGAGCDEAFSVLSEKSYPAVVSLGGTVLLYGSNPSSKDGSWSVGIRNPFAGQNDYFATLKLTANNSKNALFASTSGSYEKYFEQDGKTYFHILSPQTGYPVENDLVSVTVVSSSGITSDALSTALFVNGLDDTALFFLKSFSAQAVFVTKDGGYYITDGLKDAFKLISTEGFSEFDYELTTTA